MRIQHLRYVALLLTWSFLNAVPVAAQDIDLERVNVPATIDIAQDRDGFMWFGGWTGLYRYDGYEFTSFRHNPDDTTSLLSSGVESIFVDREGTLWIGTSRGLNRFDPATESFTRFEHDPDNPLSLGRGLVTAILDDHEGVLWVGTAVGGLNRFDRSTGTFERFEHDPDDLFSLAHNLVRTIYEDRDGRLWVGTYGGLSLFDRSSQTFTNFHHVPDDEHSLSNDWVQSIFEDSEGTFWVGTWRDGLHTLDRASGKFTRLQYDPANPGRPHRPRLVRERRELSTCVRFTCPGVAFIHEDREGYLWIGGFLGGVDRYDPKTGRSVHFEYDPENPDGLGSNEVFRISESSDGTIWIATWGGLNRVVPARTLFPYFAYGPTTKSAGAIQVDPSGLIWIATPTDGVRLIDRAEGAVTAHYTHDPEDPTSLSNNHAQSILVDGAGTLWVGTSYGGLNRFNKSTGTFSRFSIDPKDIGWSAAAIEVFEDSQGRLWVGTFQAGLNLFDRGSGAFRAFLPDPENPGSLPSDIVHLINEDRSGALWVGTGAGGVSRFDQEVGTFAHFLPGATVTALYEDQANRLWVGTLEEGLLKLDRATGDYVTYSAQNSELPDDSIIDLLGDERGMLWVVSENYLTRFDPDEHAFHTYRDLAAAPFMSIQKSDRGEFFLAGWNGFHAFYPEEVRAMSNPDPPMVSLTGFELLDQPVHPGPDSPLPPPIWTVETLTLTHNQNVFSFQFAGRHYRDPSRNQHRFMLAGYDAVWIDAGSERTARYVNVPPGDYTFRVRAANSDGVWTEEGTSIRVSILPPWWRTTWAYVLYGVVLLAGVAAVDRFQRRRLLRRQRERFMQQEVEQAHEIESMNRQLRENEEQLKEQQRRLLELDAVKSRFFANISHEFRTPLTLLLGPLEDALGEPERELRFPRRQVAAMRRSALRLLRLIDQLLDLSRLESGRMTLRARRTDLAELVRTLVAAFASAAEREHITLQFMASQEPVYAYVEPDKFENVLTNLISNAFKFTPSHGKIRVEIEKVGDEQAEIVEIVVRDTGQGIPAEELPYVFDRFHQVDASSTRTHGGVGIGLALVKELVERHGGVIDVSSRLGFGTTFRIRLPLGVDHLAPDDIVEDLPEEAVAEPAIEEAILNALDDDSATDAPDEQSSHAGAPTVLIVEDNADMRAHLRRFLSAQYRLVEAANGEEGLEQARTANPALILADVMMPRMDGYALCEAVKSDENLNHIPVVLLTAKASEESKLEGLETGADDYLCKPFSSEELLARMENLIELRRMLRDRFSGEVVVRPTEIAVPSADAAFLERAKTVVEEHLSSPDFGVDRLADEVGLSRRHLSRKLKELTDLSAAGFIRKMRLERAAQLLEQDAGTIAEIAYGVGFKSPEHFSRLFRQVFGVPPSEYASASERERQET